MRGGHGGRLWASTAALAVLAALVVAPTADAAPAGAHGEPAVHLRAPVHLQEDVSEGLRVESRSTYTADLSGSVVRVHHEVTLTNQTPDRVSGPYVEQFYFHSYSVPILAQAANVAAVRGDGRALGVAIEPVEGGLVSFAIIDLTPNLFYGDTQTVRLTYDIPGLPPRTGSIANVNPAFATFPVFAIGDPGISHVEVVVPDGLAVEVVGEPLDRSTRDGQVVYSAEAIADPVNWFTTLIVRDDTQLAERVVEYGVHEISVQGWPDDPEWLTFTADLAEDGLPVLEEVIGFGWEDDRDLVIVETVAPYVYGYGGWYEHSRSLIEVGDNLDELVTLHEMAHAWFNGDLFQGRWINEAFADEVAARAMQELGRDRPFPEPIAADDPAALPLNEWYTPDISSPESEEQEAYGYNASWSIAHQIFEELGAEDVAAVLRAADAGRSAYPAATTESRVDRTADWRTLLDLLEEVGGSTQAEQLFRDHVVPADEVGVLDDRAGARAAYDQLVAAGDGWSPPEELRDHMAAWSFSDAEELVPRVHGLLAVRDDIATDLGAIDVELPEPLQETFEASEDVEELAEVMEDADLAAGALRDAVEARDDVNPIGEVGLLLSGVDDDLDDARADMAAGRYGEVADGAEDVSDATDGAVRDGALRIMVVVVVLGLLAWGVRTGRRRRRRTAAPVEI